MSQNIHLIEEQKIKDRALVSMITSGLRVKSKDIKLVFFNKELEEHYDQYYVDLVVNSPFLFKKKPRGLIEVEWDITGLLEANYSCILLIDEIIVGAVECYILNEEDAQEYLENGDILYKNMVLNINSVNIMTQYQGLSLCTPLLAYMIKNLKKLGHNMLFINNISTTRGGVPACMCYYNSGIKNKYKMRYKDKGVVKTMKKKTCLEVNRPNHYYYMSNNISKRGVNKLKKYIRTKKPKKHK